MNEKTNINPDSSPNNQGDEALESIRTRIAEKLGNFVTQRTIRNKENTDLENNNPDQQDGNNPDQQNEAIESIRTRIAEKLGNFVTQRTIRNKENTEKDTTRQSRKEDKVLKKIYEMNEKDERRNEKDERKEEKRNEKDERKQRWTEVKKSKKEEGRNEKVRKRADRIEDQRRTVLLLEGVYGREAGRHNSLSSRTSGEYAKYKQQKKDLEISLNNGSISPVAYSEKLKMYQGEYENKRKPQRRVYKAEKKLRRLSERYYEN